MKGSCAFAGKSVMLELIKKELLAFGVEVADWEKCINSFCVDDAVKENFPQHVVTMDELDMSRNGVKHRNIRDFLTAEGWNETELADTK